MSAEPVEYDYTPTPARRVVKVRKPDLTVGGIYEALPEDCRRDFLAAVFEADLIELPKILELWDMRAVAYADPRIRAAAERGMRYLAGEEELTTVPVEDVFPGFGER